MGGYETLLILLGWWSVTQAIPILLMQNVTDASTIPYLWFSRFLLLSMVIVGFLMVHKAWSRRSADPTGGNAR